MDVPFSRAAGFVPRTREIWPRGSVPGWRRATSDDHRVSTFTLARIDDPRREKEARLTVEDFFDLSDAAGQRACFFFFIKK